MTARTRLYLRIKIAQKYIIKHSKGGLLDCGNGRFIMATYCQDRNEYAFAIGKNGRIVGRLFDLRNAMPSFPIDQDKNELTFYLPPNWNI